MYNNFESLSCKPENNKSQLNLDKNVVSNVIKIKTNRNGVISLYCNFKNLQS